MRFLTLQSPAKLNLYLRIVGRYPDGYHQLVTLFHRISLADTLRLTKKRQGFSLSCSNPNLPVDETNIVTQAYRLLQKEFPHLGGVSVQLTKKIPLGAGLGGGSSNAAFFLLGMNELYRLSLTQPRLIRLGQALGADVPFFLYNVNQAIGKGRGDEILPCPAKQRQWFVLITFKEGLSTRKVYQKLPRQLPPVFLTKVSREVRMTCGFLDRRSVLAGRNYFQNDLQPVACKLKPAIQKMIVRMQQFGAFSAGMSGSGPTVFAVLSHQLEAKRLCEKWRYYLPPDRIFYCHSF